MLSSKWVQIQFKAVSYLVVPHRVCQGIARCLDKIFPDIASFCPTQTLFLKSEIALDATININEINKQIKHVILFARDELSLCSRRSHL